MDLGNQVHLYIYTRLMYNGSMMMNMETMKGYVMITFLGQLLEHPWILLMLCTTLCVLVGQTYNFFLTLLGKNTPEPLNDDEKKILNQMKNAMKDKKDDKNKQEYIYDDNIKGVYE